MPSKGHKRKRSIEDTPVDVGLLRRVKNQVEALREHLADIEETESEMASVMTHLVALESILEGAKIPRLSFSSLSKRDLNKIGILSKRLAFRQEIINQLVENMTDKMVIEAKALCTRLAEVYNHVNMDYEPAARMVLDAVLLSIAKLSPSDKGIAILPEWRLTSGEGVAIRNRTTQYEVSLTGSVDYGIIQYGQDDDDRDRLLGGGNSRDHVLKVAKGHLFLVEAKRLDDGSRIHNFMPEAVGQALALARIAGEKRVRFCLSDGTGWIFAIVVDDNEMVYYESTVRRMETSIMKEGGELALSRIKQIIVLIQEWLNPSDIPDGSQLYELRD